MAVDLDGQLLYLLTKGGPQAVKSAQARGITPELIFSAKHRQAFILVADQAESANSTPSPEDLNALFGPVTQTTALELSWVIQHLHRRNDFRSIAKLTEDLSSLLSSNDPVKAREELLNAAEALRLNAAEGIVPASLFAQGEGVKEAYELAESGGIGIPTPWPSVNAMTMGLYPGTSTWFLARPGTGKTWIILILILHAWMHGQETGQPINVLIVSPEMDKVLLAERLFTMIAKVGFGHVVSGTLGAYGKDAFYQKIDEFAACVGIYVIDASDGITPDRIEIAIEQTNAHLVAVDSVYRIKWKERAKDRFENMYEGVDRISAMSKKKWSDGRKVAFIGVSQLNRNADKKGGKNMSAVAMADNINWEADNLFFLEQDDDMKADKVLCLLNEKARRMAEYKPKITVTWDMETMDFSELHAEEPKTYGDDDADFASF